MTRRPAAVAAQTRAQALAALLAAVIAAAQAESSQEFWAFRFDGIAP